MRRCATAPVVLGKPVKFQVSGEAGQAPAPLTGARASPADANMDHVESHSVECSECGGDVGDLEAGDECPTCGATARTHKVGLVSMVAVSSLTAEATVGYSDQATWDRQWYDLQAAYETIQRYCAGGSSIDNQEARRVVLTGCSAAWSLAEHVTDAKAGKSYRDKDADLKDASAVTNTWKHAGRDPGKTRGRIARDVGKPDGAKSIELELIEPGMAARARDALDLLKACLDAWAKYLKSVGETLDSPPSNP